MAAPGRRNVEISDLVHPERSSQFAGLKPCVIGERQIRRTRRPGAAILRRLSGGIERALVRFAPNARISTRFSDRHWTLLSRQK